MITSTQVIPLLLEACPSFERVWQEHCAKYGDEFLIYVALGDFARHLLHLQQQGQLECFESVVRVIERLHAAGDDYVREAATIGLLEAIQNYWLHGNLDLEQFETRLLPESRKW